MTEFSHQPFGVAADGQAVEQWTLRAGSYAAQVLTYGGVLRSFTVPSPDGSRDIVLGYDSLAEYEAQDKYLGALVGRVANRIGGAAFDLNGVHYSLAVNNGPNCLHGGLRGFDRAVWRHRSKTTPWFFGMSVRPGTKTFPARLRYK